MKKILLSAFIISILFYLGYAANNYSFKKKEKIIKLREIVTQQNQIISNIPKIKMELEFKENNLDLITSKKVNKLKKNLILTRHDFLNGFYSGIFEEYPGSGYLGFHEDNIIVASSRGIIAYSPVNGDKSTFKQIKNNIGNFINYNQFKKDKWFSIKDINIFNNKIYVSFTEEVKQDCWNTSIISSKFDYKKLEFQKVFYSEECISSKDNDDGEFNAHQSGGRMIFLNNNEIIFGLGDYRYRKLAQDKKSINGKIIKINLIDGSSNIISLGHRNPQGLLYDKENNFILESEHGPQGGDELNIIFLQSEEVQNYGWAVASYGEHYGGRSNENEKKYKKYPLLKSHKENNFIEPIKYFVPSIGASEVVSINDRSYVLSSLRDRSLYFFKLNSTNEISELERVEVKERIRDMIFRDNKLFLFLENSASIGIIDLSPINN